MKRWTTHSVSFQTLNFEVIWLLTFKKRKIWNLEASNLIKPSVWSWKVTKHVESHGSRRLCSCRRSWPAGPSSISKIHNCSEYPGLSKGSLTVRRAHRPHAGHDCLENPWLSMTVRMNHYCPQNPGLSIGSTILTFCGTHDYDLQDPLLSERLSRWSITI